MNQTSNRGLLVTMAHKEERAYNAEYDNGLQQS